MSQIFVFADDGNNREKASSLAGKLGLPLIRNGDTADFFLLCSEGGLSLRGSGMSLRADFRELLPRIRPNNLARELIVRAAKIKNAAGPRTVLDATAGLGEDSFLLAAAGYRVELYEYDPIIAALLSDALERAADDPDLEKVAARMQLHEEDSIEAMCSLSKAPDIVLLDPMFPERNKTAKIKKKFQLLQLLESPCADEAELLAAARAAHPRKIIIKRPKNAPPLAGQKPSYVIRGSTIRYDCIVS